MLAREGQALGMKLTDFMPRQRGGAGGRRDAG